MPTLFEEIGDMLRVTVYRRQSNSSNDRATTDDISVDKIAFRDEQIFRFLSVNSPATAQEIAEFLGQSLSATRNRLSKLMKANKLMAVGHGDRRIYFFAASKEVPE